MVEDRETIFLQTVTRFRDEKIDVFEPKDYAKCTHGRLQYLARVLYDSLFNDGEISNPAGGMQKDNVYFFDKSMVPNVVMMLGKSAREKEANEINSLSGYGAVDADNGLLSVVKLGFRSNEYVSSSGGSEGYYVLDNPKYFKMSSGTRELLHEKLGRAFPR